MVTSTKVESQKEGIYLKPNKLLGALTEAKGSITIYDLIVAFCYVFKTKFKTNKYDR